MAVPDATELGAVGGGDSDDEMLLDTMPLTSLSEAATTRLAGDGEDDDSADDTRLLLQ